MGNGQSSKITKSPKNVIDDEATTKITDTLSPASALSSTFTDYHQQLDCTTENTTDNCQQQHKNVLPDIVNNVQSNVIVSQDCNTFDSFYEHFNKLSIGESKILEKDDKLSLKTTTSDPNNCSHSSDDEAFVECQSSINNDTLTTIKIMAPILTTSKDIENSEETFIAENKLLNENDILCTNNAISNRSEEELNIDDIEKFNANFIRDLTILCPNQIDLNVTTDLPIVSNPQEVQSVILNQTIGEEMHLNNLNPTIGEEIQSHILNQTIGEEMQLNKLNETVVQDIQLNKLNETVVQDIEFDGVQKPSEQQQTPCILDQTINISNLSPPVLNETQTLEIKMPCKEMKNALPDVTATTEDGLKMNIQEDIFSSHLPSSIDLQKETFKLVDERPNETIAQPDCLFFPNRTSTIDLENIDTVEIPMEEIPFLDRRLSIRQDLYSNVEELSPPRFGNVLPTNDMATAETNRDAGPDFDATFKKPDFDATFKKPNTPFSDTFTALKSQQFGLSNEEFKSNDTVVFESADFDYLLTKGAPTNRSPDCRNSVLLRFDPLLGRPVVISQRFSGVEPTVSTEHLHKTLLQPGHQQEAAISPVFLCENAESLVTLSDSLASSKEFVSSRQSLPITKETGNATMSVGLIENMKSENDCQQFVNSSIKSENLESHMTEEIERKINHENIKSEDIEKKLKEAESKEEILLKRITDKDKAIQKMGNVLEEYEKTIAELVAEKEKLITDHEKKTAEIIIERDMNLQHLTSLEVTFSDLHAKYERSKQLTTQLNETQSKLSEDMKSNLDQLRLQEQRYEKMKSHAMQQLEIANTKLETITKTHAAEITRLKACLKKEEVSKQSISEQLNQKTKENEELVKICDELINGQGSS